MNFGLNVGLDVLYFVPGVDLGELAIRGLAKVGLDGLIHGVGDVISHLGEQGAKVVGEAVEKAFAACGVNSFAPETQVAVVAGSAAIASLKVGDQVQAYDPKTGKTKVETVDHVFINHDANLLDVTIQPVKENTKQQAQAKDAKPETLHTTSEHPFLTTDRGFVDAILLHIGEKVQQADGHYGLVVSLRVVSGMAVRYNLTVHELHTYLIGSGLWVVHNQCSPNDAENFRQSIRKVSNHETPGAGAIAAQSGSTPIEAFSGEASSNPGFDVEGHPHGAGCAETICAFKIKDQIDSGQGGWQQGVPIEMGVSQARGLSPCLGCDYVLNQLASYNGAEVKVTWSDATYGDTTTIYRPGLVPFGGS